MAYRSSICFINYISIKFIFRAVINSIVVFIFAWLCSLWIYRDMIDLFVLILYFVTLLDSRISYRRIFFIWNILGDSLCRYYCYLQIETVLFFLFSVSMPFISMSCLFLCLQLLCQIRAVRDNITSLFLS